MPTLVVGFQVALCGGSFHCSLLVLDWSQCHWTLSIWRCIILLCGDDWCKCWNKLSANLAETNFIKIKLFRRLINVGIPNYILVYKVGVGEAMSFYIVHSSQFQGLCLMKSSREMLQNLLYFWNKKTQKKFSFFISSYILWICYSGCPGLCISSVYIDQGIRCNKS